MPANPPFAILIATRNRKRDLLVTLDNIRSLLNRQDTECVVLDDGSTDGTFEVVRSQFPQVTLRRNERSKGYLFSRNAMLNACTAEFAISLDDDAHFLSTASLEIIRDYFESHLQCGLLAFRIFWGKTQPVSQDDSAQAGQVNSFVGCGHAWRMAAWRCIPSYPEWFGFYGEENFAALQLFKKGLEVHYLPQILVHHRVDLLERRKQKDYALRLRRSLRSGWYLYFLFLPWRNIPRKMAASVWAQLRLKVFKGDMRALKALILAILDFITAMPKVFRNANRLSQEEYDQWKKIPEVCIYWKPKNGL